MSAVTAARKSLAGLLEEALDGTDALTVDHVPEELPTPAVIIDAAEDWLTLADTYSPSEYWLTLRVFCLVDIRANAQAADDLEDLVAAVLPALTASAWELDPIGKPDPFHTSTWLAHGVAITVRTLITITPGDTP